MDCLKNKSVLVLILLILFIACEDDKYYVADPGKGFEINKINKHLATQKEEAFKATYLGAVEQLTSQGCELRRRVDTGGGAGNHERASEGDADVEADWFSEQAKRLTSF